jgi:hypothetical protein
LDAPFATCPSVTIVTRAPRLTACTADDTPRIPAPTTTTRLSDRRPLRIQQPFLERPVSPAMPGPRQQIGSMELRLSVAPRRSGTYWEG